MFASLTIYRRLKMQSSAHSYSRSYRWLFVIPGGAATRQQLRDMAYLHELEFICWNVTPGRPDLGGRATVEGYLETKGKLTSSSIQNKLGGNAHLELVGSRSSQPRQLIVEYIQQLADEYEEYHPLGNNSDTS